MCKISPGWFQAHVGDRCTQQSQCDTGECCQILNNYLIASKRQLVDILQGPNREGDCRCSQRVSRAVLCLESGKGAVPCLHLAEWVSRYKGASATFGLGWVSLAIMRAWAATSVMCVCRDKSVCNTCPQVCVSTVCVECVCVCVGVYIRVCVHALDVCVRVCLYFVATKVLSRQACFCRDKTRLLSRHKLYLWQLPPMIISSSRTEVFHAFQLSYFHGWYTDFTLINPEDSLFSPLFIAIPYQPGVWVQTTVEAYGENNAVFLCLFFLSSFLPIARFFLLLCLLCLLGWGAYSAYSAYWGWGAYSAYSAYWGGGPTLPIGVGGMGGAILLCRCVGVWKRGAVWGYSAHWGGGPYPAYSGGYCGGGELFCRCRRLSPSASRLRLSLSASRLRPPSPSSVAFRSLSPVGFAACRLRRGVCTEFDSGGWAAEPSTLLSPIHLVNALDRA